MTETTKAEKTIDEKILQKLVEIEFNTSPIKAGLSDAVYASLAALLAVQTTDFTDEDIKRIRSRFHSILHRLRTVK